MTTRFAGALLLGALVFSPGWAEAEDDGASLEQIVVEMAHTRAQHAALAKHYHAKAEEARALASRHLSMGRAYLGGKSMQSRPFQNHCRRIAEQQESIAQEYQAMAELHEEEAEKAE